jgi:hypothetical protein
VVGPGSLWTLWGSHLQHTGTRNRRFMKHACVLLIEEKET